MGEIACYYCLKEREAMPYQHSFCNQKQHSRRTFLYSSAVAFAGNMHAGGAGSYSNGVHAHHRATHRFYLLLDRSKTFGKEHSAGVRFVAEPKDAGFVKMNRIFT
jgi:hypothetical protein